MAKTSFFSSRYLPWWGMALAVLVIVLDQASKLWVLHSLGLRLGESVPVLPVFSLSLVHNYGISLGLFQADSAIARWALVALTLAISVWLYLWLRRADRWLIALAIGLILGGAIGNIIDRARFGYVVDFLHLHAGGYSFYVFNVADSAITVGVVLLVADGLLPRFKRAKSANG